MYEGLPIATNKLPLAERGSIPHHLLGCVRLDAETWKVGRYVRHATAIIGDMTSRGKLPIVVGGTHYYTQSLLFKGSLVDDGATEHLSVEVQEEKWPILAASTTEMLGQLRLIDPEMASRWHPNDRRKIRRSLELYLSSGKKPSDLYSEQREITSAPASSPLNVRVDRDHGVVAADEPTSGLRFDPLLLWIHADVGKLSARLDRRVDTMVQEGLVEEVEAMQKYLREQEHSGTSVDQSSGIWTAIGFKELLPCVLANSKEEFDVNVMDETKKQGIERTKTATRQYARQQERWIRNKLLRTLKENDMLSRLVVLDGTELAQWQDNVEAIAQGAVAAFLSGNPLPDTTVLRNVACEKFLPQTERQIKARYCEVCRITLMTQREWDAHPRSKKHRKATKIPVDWGAIYPTAQTADNVSHPELLSDNGCKY